MDCEYSRITTMQREFDIFLNTKWESERKPLVWKRKCERIEQIHQIAHAQLYEGCLEMSIVEYTIHYNKIFVC